MKDETEREGGRETDARDERQREDERGDIGRLRDREGGVFVTMMAF